MNRNRIFRFYQRVNQFDLFLTGMTGNMNILENNLCTFHGQFINDTGHCFFITRNRVGTENNGITWFNGNFFMNICCHTGQSCHRFSLASGCDQNHLLIRVIFHFIDINQCVVRHIQIAKFRRCSNDIDHTSTFHNYFSSVFVSRVDDLLYTVYVRCERRNDDSCIFMLCKQIIKRFSHGAF